MVRPETKLSIKHYSTSDRVHFSSNCGQGGGNSGNGGSCSGGGVGQPGGNGK